MNKGCGISKRMLIAFLLFALGIGVTMGIAGYFAAADISLDMIEDRSKALLQTMIEVERHSIEGQDEQIDPADLLESMNLRFLAGKQLNPQEAGLPDGFHMSDDGKNYIHIRHEDGIPFALSGSLGSRSEALNHVWIVFILCVSVSLVAAILLAFYFARRLSRPVRKLVEIVDKASPRREVNIPDSLLNRKDEIGMLARTLRKYQLNAINHLEREKSFASAASHELRTPLTVIAQGLELIESDAQLNVEIARTAARLLRTAKNMTSTVSNLLSLARGETLRNTKINLNEILYETIDTLFPARNFSKRVDRGLHRIAIGEDQAIQISGEIVEGNGNRFLAMTVYRNLLENALRHDNGFDVTVRFAWNFIEIQNLAEFDQNSPANSGFGLMIAQRACERMNWELTKIESGKHIIFRIQLPE